MDIYVLNRNFEVIGLIDDYSSVIWTTRYFAAGDFELTIPVTTKHVNLLGNGYCLCRDKDVEGDDENEIYRNVMLLSKGQVLTDAENGDHIVMSGPSLKAIVGQRIIWNQTNLTGNVESAIRQVITENIISPLLESRKIDNFVLDKIKGFVETIDLQTSFQPIDEWLTEICTTYGLGWDVYIKNGSFVFTLFKGVDRSYNQSENSHVVFSQEYDNLLSSDYNSDKTEYKNAALIGGEGEGASQRKQMIGEASGLDRFELYVDGSGVSSNGKIITEAQYNLMLQEFGRQSLSEVSVTEFFEGSIDGNSNYKINEDYFLGDIVEVINEYGQSGSPRIIEIIDSEDEGGFAIVPTFSTMDVTEV